MTYFTFLEWWEDQKTHAVLGFVKKEKIWVIVGKKPTSDLIENVSQVLLAMNKGYIEKNF